LVVNAEAGLKARFTLAKLSGVVGHDQQRWRRALLALVPWLARQQHIGLLPSLLQGPRSRGKL